MIDVQSNAVRRHIRRLTETSAAEQIPDGELVKQFSCKRDEESFAVLIERHGPMVLRVCQRLLQSRHDAEDVFQETFLLLARKAGAIRKPNSVASWLHGAAYRLAKKTKTREARRRNARIPIEKPTRISPELEAAWREIGLLLDEEFERLPEKYRTVMVACLLEGKTHEEASRQLGWPLGTVKCRVLRARELLRGRLARRGLTLSVMGFTTAMAANTVAAKAPPSLVQATLRQALLPAAEENTATIAAGGALKDLSAKSVLFGKVRIVALCIGAILAIGLGALLYHYRNNHKPRSPGARRDTHSALPGQPQQKNRFDAPHPPGALQRTGDLRFRHKDGISAAAFSTDGKRLATAGGDGVIRIWDPSSGKELATITTPDMHGATIAFSSDGKLLAAAGGKQIAIWDTASGKNVRTIALDKSLAASVPVAFAPDSQTLATVSSDYAIHIWRVGDGKQILQLPAQKQPMRSVSFSPDGTVLLSAAGQYQRGGTIRTWNVVTGKQLRVIQLPNDQVLTPFVFSPDGATLALEGRATKREKRKGGGLVVYTEYKVHLWDLTTGRQRLQLPGQENVIWAVAFSADSKAVAWMGMDNVLIVADAANGRIHHRLQSYPGGSRPDGRATLAFSPDGKKLAAVGSSAAVHVWDLSTGREVLTDSEAHHDSVNDVVYSPDGRTMASASSDHTVRLWNAATGKLQHKLVGHKGAVRRLVFSPDGKQIASASQDNMICIWDASTGKSLHKIPAVKRTAGIYSGITPIHISGDGKKLLSFGDDQRIHVWEVATGKEISSHPIYLRRLPSPPDIRPKKFPPFKDRIFAAEFSPDGRFLALGMHGNIYVVDARSGSFRVQLKGQNAPLHMAFSPDGHTLFSGGWDKTVRLWELATGKEIYKIDGLNHITSVAFAAGGRMIAAAGGWSQSRIHLFDTATGDKLQQCKGHNAYVGGLAFSPDAKHLTSGQRDTTLLTWDLTAAYRSRTSLRKNLTPKELGGMWSDLAGGDGRKAQTAIWTLAASPRPALAFLNSRLQPVKRTSAKRVQQLIAELDSKDFGLRERAAKELQRLGIEVESALRKSLSRNPTLEVRLRVEAILANIGQWRVWPGEDLRHVRAVQALERIGSEQALRILERLARGAPGALLTREARAARNRSVGQKKQK